MKQVIVLIVRMIFFSILTVLFEISGDINVITKAVIINNVMHTIVFFLSSHVVYLILKYLRTFNFRKWLFILYGSTCIIGVYWWAILMDDFLNGILKLDIFDWNIIYLLTLGLSKLSFFLYELFNEN